MTLSIVVDMNLSTEWAPLLIREGWPTIQRDFLKFSPAYCYAIAADASASCAWRRFEDDKCRYIGAIRHV